MAYYSGSANDMSAVRSALVDACVAEGWVWNGSAEVLSKGTLFLRLQIVSGYLTLLGRTSASAGDAPSLVRMGKMGDTAITWPVEYKVFIFQDEVYCVIRYSVDYFQWCAFGRSTVQGLSGTGMWFAASIHAGASYYPDLSPTAGAVQSWSYGSPALFWRTNTSNVSGSRDSWVHSDLDGQGWWMGPEQWWWDAGISTSVPLIGLLPNTWNSEAVLLPIRAYKTRSSSKLSLVADLQHARYTRVDNYDPGEIIELGSDRWMVFPFYRKNTAARDGGLADHSGTFGWAIRYEGV